MGKALKIWFHPKRTAEELAHLSEENDRLRLEIAEMKGRYEAAERAQHHLTQELSSEIQRFSAIEKDLKEKLDNALSDQKDLEEIERMIEMMNSEKKSFKNRIQELKRERDDAKRELNNLRTNKLLSSGKIELVQEEPKETTDWFEPLPPR